jgi:large subunit ribosomal protein L19
MDIKTVSQVKPNPNIAQVSPGDTVRVSFRVKEANRERLQTLLGLVVRVRRGANGGNFTVRRVTYAVGVEHTFPFASPLLEKVEVVRHGKVRRAKLYYIRRLSAKEARLKERREKVAAEVVIGEAADEEGTVDEVEVQEDIVGEVAATEVEVEQAAAEETERVE